MEQAMLKARNQKIPFIRNWMHGAISATSQRDEEAKMNGTDLEHYIIRLNTPEKETGIEYVCEKDDLMFFRKRKTMMR